MGIGSITRIIVVPFPVASFADQNEVRHCYIPLSGSWQPPAEVIETEVAGNFPTEDGAAIGMASLHAAELVARPDYVGKSTGTGDFKCGRWGIRADPHIIRQVEHATRASP